MSAEALLDRMDCKRTPYPGGQVRLRLLSYNIQAGIASTRFHHYLTQGWKHLLPHPRLIANLDRIARLVSDYDVVALQEVDAGSLRSSFINQTEYLAVRAGFPFWYCQTNRNLGKFAQVSIGLVSHLSATEVREHRLPGRIPGRGVMMARFGETQEALVLLIIHLALGRRARLRQIEYLAALANQYQHVVVMGDLNCQRGSPEMDALLSATRLREPAAGLNTFPSWRPYRQIDHILVSSALHVNGVQVLSHTYSDHLPVAMDISVPRNALALPPEWAS